MGFELKSRQNHERRVLGPIRTNFADFGHAGDSVQ